MATLSFKDRKIEASPTWLGNRDQEPPRRPFRVRISRLTRAELDAFAERADELLGKRTVTADELRDLFRGVVDGPVGELEIDGEHVTDFARLMHFAAMESPWVPGALSVELAGFVTALNSLTNDASGN